MKEADTGYLVLNSVSIADLAIFHELVNATTVAKVKPNADQFPCLVKWQQDLESMAPVRLGMDKFMSQYERFDE